MTQLDENLKTKNLEIFLEKLKQVGAELTNLDDETMEKIKNAPFGLSIDKGGISGCMIETVLKTLTVYAVKINELLPVTAKVDKNSLVKVCLLHQLSKAEMFVENDNKFEVEKRGMVYKYAPSNVALKMGMKSLLLAQRLGVTFTDEEAEAMVVLDKDDADEQTKFFASPISVVLKQAANLTYLKMRYDNGK